jgi:hypothetical protein
MAEAKKSTIAPTPNKSGSEVDIRIFELQCLDQVINLAPYIMNMNIYEDMMGNFITADLMLNDSVNLPVHGPLVGQEYLDFQFATKSLGTLTSGFMPLISIKKRYLTKERQQVYMLHFVSMACITNATFKISKSFRGMTVSDMAEKIIFDYFDEAEWEKILVEPTEGMHNVVIPNWQPFKALNWLTKRAVNQNGCANYLCYETMSSVEEEYPLMLFESVDRAMSRTAKRKFIYSASVEDTKKIVKASQGISELLDMKIASQFNTIENMDRGYYASKLITHDIVKKKIRQQTHSLADVYTPDINHSDIYMPIRADGYDYPWDDLSADIGQTSFSYAPEDNARPNDGISFETVYDSKIMFYPKHDRMYAKSKTDLYDNGVENWKLNRNTMIQGLNQIKLMIAFPGFSTIHAGDTIDVIVPAAQKVIEKKPGEVANKEDLIDKQLSGKYLITVLKHCITKSDRTLFYIAKAEVVKDAIGAAP